jgi:hypothetical protein
LTSSIFRVSEYDTEFVLNIQDDFFLVTGNSKIFTAQHLSYMWITDHTIRDFSANLVRGVPSKYALLMGPCIIQWNLNLNSGKLTMVFSEPVEADFSLNDRVAMQSVYDASDVRPSEITRYVLTTTASPDLSRDDASNRTFIFTLDPFDLNSFKLDPVLRMNATGIYLTASYGLSHAKIGDGVVQYLPTVELENRTALRIREYIEDVTPPVCLYFGLDLSNGYVPFLLLKFFFFSSSSSSPSPHSPSPPSFFSFFSHHHME